MFTGIVRAIAPLEVVARSGPLLRYALNFPSELLPGLELGASVSIDGVCQSVVSIQNTQVWFEAIEETLSRTTLGELNVGSQVNLERSAKIGDEIGGHLLSGHIYGTALLTEIEKNIYTFQCPPPWTKYLFPKGFIAIDGASLTLVEVDKRQGRFTIHLIPETLKRTTLGQKKVGDRVNLEFDALTLVTVETVEDILNAETQRFTEGSRGAHFLPEGLFVRRE